MKNPLDKLRTKTFRIGGYSVAAMAIVIAIAVVVNLFVSAIPGKYTQFDTSAGQLYSLSQETEQLLGSLDQNVTVYWVARGGYEDETLGHLLDRYAAQTRHLTVLSRDPDVYPTLVQAYTSSFTDNSLIVVSGDRSRYVDYYEIYEYDYSNYYVDYSYSVNFAGESALTSAIAYVVSTTTPVIYTLTGHGEVELSTTFQQAIQRQNMSLSSLSLLTVEEIPSDTAMLIACVPSSDLSMEELAMLRNYLANGGNWMLISQTPEDGVSMTGWESLMGDYGVEAVPGIVVEADHNHFAFNTPYYLLPTLGEHAITEPLREGGYYVGLPVSQGLRVTQSQNNLDNNLEITELLTTSSSAFSKIAGWQLQTYERESGDIDGPFTLGVAISCGDSHILWFSSAGILDDSANQMVSGGNLDLFLNALSWACQPEESQMSIHAKSLDQTHLTMSSQTASILSAVFIGVIPLLTLGTGIFIRQRRVHR